MSSVARTRRSPGVRLGSLFRAVGMDGRADGGSVEMNASVAGQICESGSNLSKGKKLFHDADQHPPRFQQTGTSSTALETLNFDGSYISIVVQLSPVEAAKIAAGVDLIVHLEVTAEPALPVYLRAHFANEEGREVLHDLIVVASGTRDVRFNLDGLRIPVDLATSAWVDIIFSDPAGAALSFADLSLAILEQ